MNKTRKMILVVSAILLTATLVSAALLPYFGKVNTTMNVQQSIVIGEKVDDQIQWNNYDVPVQRDLGNVVHCTDYCYKLWIKNQACKPANVFINDVCTAAPAWNNGWDSTGIDITHHIFGDSQTIQLIQKEVVWGQSPWYPLTDGMEATLTFNTCGQTFDWSIESNDNLDGYSLIYYANYPEYWSEGPVTVIGSGSSGSFNGATMPFVDDENAQRPISELGETYEHNYGAKFWLVPTEAIEGNDVDWGMAQDFLFETDLGFYMDCDDMSPVCLPNVYPIFDTTVLQAESTYCWITCYHVVFDIMGGNYAFETTLTASEIVDPQPQI
jgi:hypothetical protein